MDMLCVLGAGSYLIVKGVGGKSEMEKRKGHGWGSRKDVRRGDIEGPAAGVRVVASTCLAQH
jgi:hypothetical protein